MADDGSMVLSDIISNVSNVAGKLDQSLPNVLNSMEEMKNADSRMQEALESASPVLNEKILVDLREQYCDFILAGKRFLEQCLAMASYATMDITEIKDELKAKTLDELKKYIGSISFYLDSCDKCFVKYEKVWKELKEVTEEINTKCDQAEEEAQIAVERHEESIVAKENARGIAKTFILCGGASVVAGNFGILAPKNAFLSSLGSVFAACLATINEGKALLDVQKQERERKKKIIIEKMYQDAVKSVCCLYLSISDVSILVKRMKAQCDSASDVIDQKRGLQEYADSNKQDIDFRDLINKLDMLQRACRGIVDTIGEKGTRPLGSISEEFPSNTQPQQVTDRADVSASAMMKSLSIQNQTNGRRRSPPPQQDQPPLLEESRHQGARPNPLQLVTGRISPSENREQ